MNHAPPRDRAETVALLRRRAESEEDEQIRAAYAEWGQMLPHIAIVRAVPIRSNSPRAGESGYEPESPAPHMTRTGWLVAAGCCLAGAFVWWWLLSWAAGVIGGGR